jgi:excisionase family DNA binding protein
MASTDENKQDYLSVGETALLLRVSRSSVYTAVREGRLPALQLGERGTIRIHRRDLKPKP